ncbi:MAG TPA: AraC family transcriptional regulator [Pseudonocardia sp.]|nr:AraC family transcriptional regulator [Pseudonocardia sp.]
MWLWPGHALYVGPSLHLGPHSGAVSCLAVAMQGTFTVVVDGTSGPAAGSALIAPRVTHQLVARSELMAFCYLDPGSARHRACRRAMTVAGDPVAYRHRQEHALAGAVHALDDHAEAQAWLDLAADRPPPDRRDPPSALTGGRPRRAGEPLDPRIAAALAALHTMDLQHPRSAAQLASLVGLSPSRFLHLFRAGTGTSLRRYRTWLRMIRAADELRRGGDLTTAALDAGFASPSHFSDTVLAMFGLRPHQLRGTDIRVAGSTAPDPSSSAPGPLPAAHVRSRAPARPG